MPAARPSPVVTVARALLEDLTRLVVPVECPGCGLVDRTVCPQCRRALVGPARRVEAQVPRLDRMDGRAPLPVWALAEYSGPVRGLVVAWKDRGRSDLTPVLCTSMRDAAGDTYGALRAAVGAGPVAVVPVPPAPGSRRRRGGDLVADLATAVADGLRQVGVDAQVERALRRRRTPDQVGLGARARGRNAGAGYLLRSDRRVRQAWCVLVDDVVTTGSTLAACEQVLGRAGGRVLAAVVLAATPGPTDRGR